MKYPMKIAIVVMLCVPALLAAQSAQPPTLADIKSDFGAAKYQDVIKKSLRALAVKGDAAKQPERGAIEALKAESHLHLKQFPQAGEAFTAAAKDSIDAKDIGLYRA